MKVYSYDRQTRELVGTSYADPDPLEEGNLLIPAHATHIEPPAPRAGFAVVWNGAAWGYVPDHRGETWFTADGLAVTILEPGDPVVRGLLREDPSPPPPPPPAPTLADLQAKLEEIQAAMAKLAAA